MPDKKRAVVIGVGLLGTRHSQELAEDQRVDLVAVADLRLDKAEQIAAKWSCRAYADYQQMLAAEKPDIAVVATPDPYHREPVVACAQAGVPHILMQKPMATTVEDAEAMMAAAKAGGSQIYLIFATRWFPANIATHYAMRCGVIGKPVYGEVLTDDSITVPREMWGARGQTWADASSTAHFLHSHLVDRLRWYLHPAEVTRVFAMEQREVLGFAPDLYDSFLFFDNGFKAPRQDRLDPLYRDGRREPQRLQHHPGPRGEQHVGGLWALCGLADERLGRHAGGGPGGLPAGAAGERAVVAAGVPQDARHRLGTWDSAGDRAGAGRLRAPQPDNGHSRRHL